MSLRFLMGSAALVALSACGGGGAGGFLVFPPTTLGDGTASYTELQNDLLNFDTYRANGSSSSLPTSGGATYGGTMVVADDLYNIGGQYINGTVIVDGSPISPNGYIGEVQLMASFNVGGGTVTGVARNFYSTDLDTSTGAATGNEVALGAGSELDFTNGTFTGPSIFTMDVSGTLDTKPAGGSLIVGFFGPDGQTILAESLAAGGMTLSGINTDARLSARQ